MNLKKINIITKIDLSNLNLKTFTEQDALDYCQINNLNSNNITELLNLQLNELIDISGVKLFKNIKRLWLNFNEINDISIIKNLKKIQDLNISNNKIKDISVLEDLTKLKILNISYNQIIDIRVLKYLKNLKQLNIGNNKIKNISVIKYLTELRLLDIDYLKLESDQLQYINSLKNLEELWCEKGFKNMKIIKQLNKNIKYIINK